jgi:hypothetical protein
MVQAPKLRCTNNLGLRRSVLCSRSTCGRLLRQSQVRPVVMVVADVFGHEPFEMPLVEDDDVIEQVPAAVADKALGDAVLPRASEAGPLGLNAEALHCVDDIFAEVRRPVEDQILRCRVVRESLAQLLRDPRAGRMPGDAEVQNPPSIMRDHEETVKHPKGECRHGEEVHRPAIPHLRSEIWGTRFRGDAIRCRPPAPYLRG